MKILQIIKKELIPLSSRQRLALLLIITAIFQFVLFYTPVLADQAVKQAQAQASEQNRLIVNDVITRSPFINKEAAKLIGPIIPIAFINTIATTSKISALNQKTNKTKIKTTINIKTKNRTHVKILVTSTHIITAYNSEVSQTDNSPCITANGFNVCKHGQEDTIAANFLKFGTKVKIPELFGSRIFTVRDRMNKKNDNRIDVWMKKRSSALKFGKRIAKIQVVQIVK